MRHFAEEPDCINPRQNTEACETKNWIAINFFFFFLKIYLEGSITQASWPCRQVLGKSIRRAWHLRRLQSIALQNKEP